MAKYFYNESRFRNFYGSELSEDFEFRSDVKSDGVFGASKNTAFLTL